MSNKEVKRKLEFQFNRISLLIKKVNELKYIYENWDDIPPRNKGFFLHYCYDKHDIIILDLTKIFKCSEKYSYHKIFNILESNGLNKGVPDYFKLKEKYIELKKEFEPLEDDRDVRIAHNDSNQIVLTIKFYSKLENIILRSREITGKLFEEMFNEGFIWEDISTDSLSVKEIINILKINFEESQKLIWKDGLAKKDYKNVGLGFKKLLGEKYKQQ